MEPSTFVSVICFSVALLCPIALSYSVEPPKALYRPAPAPTYESGEKNARIISQSFDIEPSDSSFQYSFETENGLSVQAHGYLKGDGQVIEGSFVQPNAEGNPSRITYIADENGYQPQGDGIPTVPPIIAKSIAYLKSLPPTPEAYSAGSPVFSPYYKVKRGN